MKKNDSSNNVTVSDVVIETLIEWRVEVFSERVDKKLEKGILSAGEYYGTKVTIRRGEGGFIGADTRAAALKDYKKAIAEYEAGGHYEARPEYNLGESAQTPEAIAGQLNLKFDGVQEGAKGKEWFTFTDSQTGTTFLVGKLSDTIRKL